MNRLKQSGILILLYLLFLAFSCVYTTTGSIAEERPSYNTGTGFFTVGHKIYDANGDEFIPRGVNVDHWGGNDGDAAHRAAIPAIKRSGANSVRIVFGPDLGDGWNNLNQTSEQREEVVRCYVDNHLVPIITFMIKDSENHKNHNAKETLDNAVNLRITDRAWLKKYEKYVIINILNEWQTWWNPEATDETDAWYQGYLDAIQKLRENGINNLLLIDSAQWAGTPRALLKRGKKLIEADPQHNIAFAMHTYGGWRKAGDPITINNVAYFFDTPIMLDQLIAAQIPVMFGEFNNSAYAEGAISDEEFINYLEERGIGWMAWIWYMNPKEDVVTSLNTAENRRINYTKFGKIIHNALKEAQEPDIFPGGILVPEPEPEPGPWVNPGWIKIDTDNFGAWWLQIKTESTDCVHIEIENQDNVISEMTPWGSRCFTYNGPIENKTLRLWAYNNNGEVAKTAWFTVTIPIDNPVLEWDESHDDPPASDDGGGDDGGAESPNDPPPSDNDGGGDSGGPEPGSWVNPGWIKVDTNNLGSWWLQIKTESADYDHIDIEDQENAVSAMTPWGSRCFTYNGPIENKTLRLWAYNNDGAVAKTAWFTITIPLENPVLEWDTSQDDPPASDDGADGPPPSESSDIRAYFIGNSYTVVNNLPEMVKQIAATSKVPDNITYDRKTYGGQDLKYHWESGNGRQAIADTGPWDYVVLQPYWLNTTGDDELFYKYARLWDDYNISQGAKSIIWTQWVSDYAEPRKTNYYNQVTNATHKLCTERNIPNSYVAQSFWETEKRKPDYKLYSDGNHATEGGTYLAACSIYITLTGGKSPVGATYTAGLSKSDALFFQQVAWDVYQQESNNDDSDTTEYAPVIKTTAPTDAKVGIEYSYYAGVSEKNASGTLTWSLDEGPPGMSIDQATGMVTWTPATSYAGTTVDCSIKVTDNHGAFDTEKFTITISGAENGNGTWTPGKVRVCHVTDWWMQVSTENDVAQVFLEMDNASLELTLNCGTPPDKICYKSFRAPGYIGNFVDQNVRLKFVSDSGEIALTQPFKLSKTGYPGYYPAVQGGNSVPADTQPPTTPPDPISPADDGALTGAEHASGRIPDQLPDKFLLGLFEGKNQKGANETWMEESGVPWNSRYLYLTNGWSKWWPNGSYASDFMEYCDTINTIPVIQYYCMNGLDGTYEDQFYEKSKKPEVMKQYYEEFIVLMQKVKEFNKPVMILIEADGFANMQQMGKSTEAYSAVEATGVSELEGLPDTVAGWGMAFLKIRKELNASNAVLGMHVSGWASGKDVLYFSSQDDLQPEVEAIYSFLSPMGLGANQTGDTYDIIVTDGLDRDPGFYEKERNQNRWLDDSDTAPVNTKSFNRWAQWLKLVNKISNKRILIWQIPLGHSQHLNVKNNGEPGQGYKGNFPEYFLLDDSFNHLKKFADCGVIGLLFGPGAQYQSSYLNDHYDFSNGEEPGLFMKSRAMAFYERGGMTLAREGHPSNTGSDSDPDPVPDPVPDAIPDPDPTPNPEPVPDPVPNSELNGIKVTPAITAVDINGSIKFSAVSSGTTTDSLKWRVLESGYGTIDQDGNYKAPAKLTQGAAHTFHVVAENTGNTNERGMATVRLITPDETPGVTYIGRFDDSGKSSWPGTGIRAFFKGADISAKFERFDTWATNFVNVNIDNVSNKKIKIDKNGTFLLAEGLSDDIHFVEISRRDEAAYGTLQFKGFTFKNGQLLAAPEHSPRKIEFIGDSMTCGYGNEGELDADFTTATENNDMTFGAIAARRLGAEFVTIAWSGKGLYKNRDGSTNETMPELYKRTFAKDPASTWDFKKWVPQVVVINLGTNDYPAGVDKAGFVKAYKRLIIDIRNRYDHNVHIFCTIGSMLGGNGLTTMRTWIRDDVVNSLNTAGDSNVHFLEFAPQEEKDGYGTHMHPSLKTHARMARELVAGIRKEVSEYRSAEILSDPTDTDTAEEKPDAGSSTSDASMEISGKISVDTTFTKAESPYYIVGDVWIDHGARLTIEPGVKIIFKGHHRFTVNGSIDARGTADERIVFTALNKEEGWFGMRLWGGGKRNYSQGLPDLVDQYIEYCIFEYGNKDNQKSSDPTYKNQSCYNDIRGGALYINYEYSKLTGTNGRLIHLNNNIFRYNKCVDRGGALTIATINENWTMENNVFENNFANNQGGAFAYTHANRLTLKNCKFINNSTAGKHVYDRDKNLGIGGACRIFDSQLAFEECIFENNSPDNFAGGAQYDTDGNEYTGPASGGSYRYYRK